MIHFVTKTVVVIVSTTILSTLAVNAIDMRGNWAHTLLGSLFFAVQKEELSPCPEHMTYVGHALEPYCIDTFEASPQDSCVYEAPSSPQDTVLNLADTACGAQSKMGAEPWTYISQHDAQKACAHAGKRLATAGEWYMAAVGTLDVSGGYSADQCNVARNRADGVAPTGAGMRCVSDVGVYDMVGNVWEWVGEEVVMGEWQGRAVPETGYVQGVDMYGVAYSTGGVSAETFVGDKFWSDSAMHAGMMRGGYFDSKQSAGVFATYAASQPEFVGEAVGFRCVTAPRAML